MTNKYRDLLLGAPTSPSAAPAAPSTGGKNYKDLALGLNPSKVPSPAAEPEQKPFMERMAQGFIDTALPFSDEIEAGLRAGYSGLDRMLGDLLPGQQETYEEALADVESRRQGAAYYAGMPLGIVAPGGIAATAGKVAASKGLGRAAQYGTAAAASAGEGALFAAGDADPGERLAAVPAGAAIGGVAGVAGQRLGEGLTSYMERKLVDDIDKLDNIEMDRLKGLAEGEGIQLTPAELSDLPSLKAQQRVVGQSARFGDDLDEFNRMRGEEQIDPAIERFLSGVSDIEGEEAAGDLARAAGKAGMQKIAENRAAQAAPIYERAFEEAPSVDIRPVLDKIDSMKERFAEKGRVGSALRKVEGLVTKEGPGSYLPARKAPEWAKKSARTPLTDLQRLHSSKVEIDDLIEEAETNAAKGARTSLATLVELKEDLLKVMDDASPTYQEARNIFADLSPGVDRVREGLAGKVAGLQDTQLKNAASKLLGKGQVSVRGANEAKRVLQDADPTAWQAVKRSFLEENWIKAQKEMVDGDAPNRGAKFRQALLGDKKQRAILEATMEPDEFRALSDLGDVLAATGRVKRMGSDTAQNLEMKKIMEQGAGSKLARFIQALHPGEAHRMLVQKVDEASLISKGRRMVEAITSPDGVEMMKELKRAGVTANTAAAIIGQWVAQSGAKPFASLSAASPGAAVAEDEPAAAPLAFDFQRDAEGNIIGATPR